MQLIHLGQSDVQSSRLIYGCMRVIGDGSPSARDNGKAAIHTAIDAGFNHLDHADIYGAGECERLFGDMLKERPSLRDDVILTSKCGIRFSGAPKESDPTRYDFRKQYIMQCVEGSLQRLGTDYLDVLLLHRPDFLMDADEVAEAFSELYGAGKVRHFGVSNFSPSRLALLQTACEFPLIVNQVEINIHNISALSDGTLDQCMELGLSPQAWCPLGGVAYPAWGNTFSKADETRIKAEFERQSESYGTEPWIIMLAWLLTHPAKILPILGSTNPDRIRVATKALAIDYSREDWYRLLEARNGESVP